MSCVIFNKSWELYINKHKRYLTLRISQDTLYCYTGWFLLSAMVLQPYRLQKQFREWLQSSPYHEWTQYNVPWYFWVLRYSQWQLLLTVIVSDTIIFTFPEEAIGCMYHKTYIVPYPRLHPLPNILSGALPIMQKVSF